MKKHELSLESDLKLEEMFLKFKYDEIKKKTVNTNLKQQKLRRCDDTSRSISCTKCSKLTHKLLHHSLNFGNSSPAASYGCDEETQNCIHKQYLNTLYPPGGP